MEQKISATIAKKRPLVFIIYFSLILLGTISGCGKEPIYPVEGKVLDKEGKAFPDLAGSTVEFDSLEAKVSASGTIQEDGSFQLSTKKQNDGAWVGKHKVLIGRKFFNVDTPAPRVIPAKYEDYATSELTAEVKPGKNTIIFHVDRIKGKK
jgi:hypothetical protein